MKKKNKLSSLIANCTFKKRKKKGNSKDVFFAHVMQSQFVWSFVKR